MKEQDKNRYQVLLTNQFEEELRKILLCIADNAQSVEAALSMLDDVKKAVCSLAEFPEHGAIP